MSDEPGESPSTRRIVELKGFRIDIVIAVCALLVSSMATAASVWQSRIVAQQLSSQIWPYVAIQTSRNATSMSATISNEGLGPARVRWLVVTIDNKPQRTFLSAMRTLVPGKDVVVNDASFSDIAPGHVIRVGGAVQIFRITDRSMISTLARNFHRIKLEVCYCPIIEGECWIVASGGANVAGSDPQIVAACPKREADTFTSGLEP